MSNLNAFNNKRSSDFTIENNDKTEILYLHKIILSSNEYFNALFGDKFKNVDKLYFDNIDIPKMLIYYIYTEKSYIEIKDIQFNELIMVLSLANEWLMFDYMKSIVDEYMKHNNLDIKQLMSLNMYYKNILNDDRVKKIITDDIKYNMMNDELLKYKDIDIERLDLESKIILHTYFGNCEDINDLLKLYRYDLIYDVLKKLIPHSKDMYLIYSTFCNFVLSNKKYIINSLSEPCESLIGLDTEYYKIETIYPLILSVFKLLKILNFGCKSKNTKINIYNIQSSLNIKEPLIIIDRTDNSINGKYFYANVLNIKIDGHEVNVADKYKDVSIKIDVITNLIEREKKAIYTVKSRSYV
jgi:hypothetical protein